uniref:Uncharacterized protein n=1 Tax=Rhizophagus irregularis (strain DAOM 181602 / DAOM 197198 / MUCL 43194) TaxID=747089 RepID=U9TZ99_RHIID
MTTYFDNLQRNYTGVSIMEECIETISIFLKKFGVVLSKIYIPEKLVNEQVSFSEAYSVTTWNARPT